MTIWDMFVKFDEQDVWVVLYFLGGLEDNVGAKSKYIARIIQKPSREVVSRLIKLERLGLVEKTLAIRELALWGGSCRSNPYPTHLWIISENGKDLIDSRKSLDTKGHFQTTQRLSELIPPPFPLITRVNGKDWLVQLHYPVFRRSLFATFRVSLQTFSLWRIGQTLISASYDKK